jgi:hypothetical protein
MYSAIPLALILGAVAAAVVRRAFLAETRSRKLGGLGAACGVAAFAPAILGPGFASAEAKGAVVACGALTLALAASAIGLAACAVFARRKEPSGKSPLFGFILGTVNLACGSGVLVSGLGVLAPAAGTPSVWRSEEHGFEITIPTELWERHANPNVLAEFRCRRPALSASVIKADPAPTDAAYESVLAFHKAQAAKVRHSDVVERTGPNAHGLHHWLMRGKYSSDGKESLFGVSVTRVGGSAVLLMFEGPYRMMSESGRAQEASALLKQSELFLGSVRAISPAPAQ